jgi:hypothetical protein
MNARRNECCRHFNEGGKGMKDDIALPSIKEILIQDLEHKYHMWTHYGGAEEDELLEFRKFCIGWADFFWVAHKTAERSKPQREHPRTLPRRPHGNGGNKTAPVAEEEQS